MLLENWPRPVRWLLMWLLGVNWAHKFLIRLSHDKPSKLKLLDRIFERNSFDVQVTGEEQMPSDPGFIIATNHPHGLFDGLGGIWLGAKNGHDSRAIGRHFLSVFEPIKDWFLLVKVDANRQAHEARQVLEQSEEFLKAGGSLVITPSARVSAAKTPWGNPEDLPWKTGVVKLHQSAQVPIVLVFTDMNRSAIRQLSQSIHGVVRALLQVWAYRFGRTQKLHLHVLEVIQPDQIPPGTAREQTDWLQQRFEDLSMKISENN